MKIAIRLPANRVKFGELRLLSGGGSVMLVAPCLGKADGRRAAGEGNPARDPVKPYGDTPLGDYAPAAVRHLDPPHPHMGAIVIPLQGVAGDALSAMALRRDLFIHGGRGNSTLIPTFGCVRLLDHDMAQLAMLMAEAAAEISIDLMSEPKPKPEPEKPDA